MGEDTPQGDPVVETAPDAGLEQPVAAPPTKWYRVEYVARAGETLPFAAGGKWWAERTAHTLPASCAQTLAVQPGFTILRETEAPVGAQDCGCGG